ncbi:zinc-dependent metalloprotease [Rhodococcus antarcticus]|uniref:Zinc-dependent metalloprotease n=1 Tax=Rhodococcus antarcticus TaxID=2987751 RepID=A0ABY6NYG0_9NOCA|nr:zinc-dependent metalloprotease [Rhodococcus antarcticus]UZJ24430.1 zinc-dependent metalloprotease [Rhodococcus antarcticus]
MNPQLPVVDWPLAGRTAARLARPGPTTTRAEAAAVVAELADAAVRAEAPVREVTRLADGLPVAPALVVDRARWARAAAASTGSLTGTARVPGGPGPGITGRAAALQAGALLGYLSGAILGQFDPFTHQPGTSTGTLLLVAPNVVAVERALRVDPHDFRLWVCLHEVTHRVQFTAVPWLSGYMAETVGTLTAPEQGGLPLGRVLEVVRSGERPDGVVGLVRSLQTPGQRRALDRLLALGTLLEGHADHVMDSVGPAVVPSVRGIRTAFDRRRTRPTNPVHRVLRALLGVDAKIAQYVRGKAFVDRVVATAGMDGFNAVWTSTDTLPTDAEITEPDRWVRRVLG